MMTTQAIAMAVNGCTLPALYGGRNALRARVDADDVYVERQIADWQPIGKIRVLGDGSVSYAYLQWEGPEIRAAVEARANG